MFSSFFFVNQKQIIIYLKIDIFGSIYQELNMHAYQLIYFIM